MRTSLLFALSFVPVLVTASPLSVTALWVQNPSCSQPTGAINIAVSGGTAPYTYAWNDLEVTEDLVGLGPGYYEVTVTDALSQQVTQGWTLTPTPLSSPESAQDGHANCIEQTMGGEVQVIEWGINGTPPYSYNPPPAGVDPDGDPFFYFPFADPGSTVTIDVTDANGCTGTLSETIVIPQLYGGPQMVLQNAQGSCTGGSGGAATLDNLNDGYFFQGPALYLFDAANNGVNSWYNIPNAFTITGLAPGHYHVLRDWNWSYQYTAFPCADSDTLGFDIPDLGVACGTVSGNVFIDNNDDCAQNVSEVGVPYEVLEIQPGPQYAITGANGHYAFDIGDGSYTMQQNNVTVTQRCPVAVPVPFTMAGNAQVIDLADSSLVPLDMAIHVNSSAMRTGIGGTIWMNVRNLSAQVSGPVTVTLQLDNVLGFASAFPVPSDISGNTLTWDLTPFTAYQQQDFAVSVQIPVGTQLGTLLLSVANVSNTAPEDVVDNNNALLNGLVVGPFDPNTKTVLSSPGQMSDFFFIDQDDHLDYVIHFQNTGNAEAQTVVVTDTLSDDLDMGSFEQGAASHPFDVSFRPGRVVQWTFAGINLPDSGSDFLGSQGAVAFRIRPRADILGGTVIVNAADIFFDQNDPVRTDAAEIEAAFSVGFAKDDGSSRSIHLFPNPTSDGVTVSSPTDMKILRLIAMDGRTLAQQRAVGRLTPLDMSLLDTGTYIIEATDITGRVSRGKVIKR